MYYFCNDYPMKPLQEISEAEIQGALTQVRADSSGFCVTGEGGQNAVLMPEAWLEYLMETDHKDRIYDMLNAAIVKDEDPESAMRYAKNHLGAMGFREVRRIYEDTKSHLGEYAALTYRKSWDAFLVGLANQADTDENIYRRIPHIEWAVPGPEYSLMIFCRDQKLRYLDISPLMGQAPFHRIKDTDIFRSVKVYYGALTWFPEDGGMEIDISPEWCYDHGVEIDLHAMAETVQNENPIRSIDLTVLEQPSITVKQWHHLPLEEPMEEKFMELFLPDPAAENYPQMPKFCYGSPEDINAYMNALRTGPLADFNTNRLEAYRKYCDGDTQVKLTCLGIPTLLLTPRKVEYWQQICLEGIHWIYTDPYNRMIPLRAKRIILDQVILKIGEKYVYCIRPNFEGLERANFQLSRWMPVEKTFFSEPDVIERQGDRYITRLYMESGQYSTFGLAMTAMQIPAQTNFSAVMDEFFALGD